MKAAQAGLPTLLDCAGIGVDNPTTSKIQKDPQADKIGCPDATGCFAAQLIFASTAAHSSRYPHTRHLN